MKIERDYKVGIVTGLIASALFLYFLDPILKFFGTLVFGVFSHVYGAYLDRLFAKAALGATPNPGMFILAGLNGLFAGMATAIIHNLIFKKKKEEENPAEKSKFFSKRTRWALSLVLVLIVLLNFHYYWGTWFQFKLVTSFEQHITAVAPYLSEHDEKVLKSRWTQMKNRKDYEKIYEDLRQIAATNNISLPDNLIYSINDF